MRSPHRLWSMRLVHKSGGSTTCPSPSITLTPLVALISPSRDLGQDTSSTPGGRGPLSAPRAHRGSSSILVTVVTAPVTARGAVPPARRPKSPPSRLGGGREGDLPPLR